MSVGHCQRNSVIRTVQDLLGNDNLQITMICTYVPRNSNLGVHSPLERLPSGG